MNVIKWLAARLGFHTPESKPTPELSCFVRGLIRSLNESPEEWKVDETSIWHSNRPISMWDRCGAFSVTGAGEVGLTPQEITALKVACKDFRNRGPKQIRQAFEKLGCPDNP